MHCMKSEDNIEGICKNKKSYNELYKPENNIFITSPFN
jgi:hypothetical protein